MDTLEKQALTDHLRDLRNSLIRSLVAVCIGFGVSYYFVQGIGEWFLRPLYEVLPEGSQLIFTSYQEAFFFI
ncbi:MAG: twin-arginine translocase subunit TatC [Desulfobulbaceae bacterium]|nr:twin-arginine translocase subunit TatC [Desulfobulbaceae bacterium]